MYQPGPRQLQFTHLLIAAMAVLPLVPLLGAPLLADERVLFYEARKFVALDPWAPFQLPIGGSGSFRPLSTYAFWLDAGSPPYISHAINLGLYLILVFVARSWMQQSFSWPAAQLGTAFFAVHGVHVASAGWVAARADLLMGLAVTASLLAQGRGRSVLSALLAGIAVLFKETGIAVLPMLLWSAWLSPRSVNQRWLAALLAALLLAPLFALTVMRAEVAASYWPSLDGLLAGLLWLPLYIVQLFAPLYQPLGALSRPGDQLGLLVAVAFVLPFLLLGWRVIARLWALGLGLTFLAVLPVLHVLPNDGGQWYLLLPSVGASYCWAAVMEQRLGRAPGHVVGMRRTYLLVGLLLLLFAFHSLWQSCRWQEASVRVDRMIEAARVERQAGGLAMGPMPQDPSSWPHLGPSLCCGFPYQLFEPVPPRWPGSAPLSSPDSGE
ncbi:MAG: hypothetical protein CMP23_14315 [Rickettsiales bacterium]|nr:hypothetical protein [Rickettsiales bacterium]